MPLYTTVDNPLSKQHDSSSLRRRACTNERLEANILIMVIIMVDRKKEPERGARTPRQRVARDVWPWRHGIQNNGRFQPPPRFEI